MLFRSDFSPHLLYKTETYCNVCQPEQFVLKIVENMNEAVFITFECEKLLTDDACIANICSFTDMEVM